MKFLIVILILVLIAFSLKVLSLLLRRVSENSSIGKKITSFEPLTALFVWIIFVFWAVNFLFYDKTYYNFIVFTLIVLVILAVSWFFIKDFVAGISFRVQNNYSPGDNVQFGKISGRLDKLFLTHVSIYTSEGRLVKIPYSRLSNEIVSHKSTSGYSGNSKFIFKAPKNKPIGELKKSINSILMASPWRLPSRTPMVTLKSESEDVFEFEIQFETRSNQHLEYVIAYLDKRFGNSKGAGISAPLLN